MSVGEAARKRAMKAKGGNGTVVGFALVVAAGFFSIPFVAHYTKIRRGAYANSGSRDAGVDPDWDLKTGTYHGRRGPSVKHATGSKRADE
ncbi:hypothetical protein ON010_g14984 [Phytophthora cinnamomi]|nr:hypothetical protein ON010_g14984 [Phytophthora cinnamomi]